MTGCGSPTPVGRWFAWIAAAVMLATGGAVSASNMGFKFHKQLFFAGSGQIGDNWLSIPFRNPYPNVATLCGLLGLVATGPVGSPRATVTFVNPTTGISATTTCGSAAGGEVPLPADGRGSRVRQPNALGAATRTVIVGSHDPSLVVRIPDAGIGTIGDFWFSVPYHKTAVTIPAHY